MTSLLAAITFAMIGFPETSAIRWLHRHCVQIPLALIGRLERKHLLFLVVGLVAIQALAMVATLDLAMLFAWDATLYVDIVLATATAATVNRSKMALAWTRTRFSPVRSRRPRTQPRARAKRLSETRPTRLPANDDEGPAFVSMKAA